MPITISMIVVAANPTLAEAAFLVPVMVLWTVVFAALFVDYHGWLTKVSEAGAQQKFRRLSVQSEWRLGRLVSAMGFFVCLGLLVAEIIGLGTGRIA